MLLKGVPYIRALMANSNLQHSICGNIGQHLQGCKCTHYATIAGVAASGINAANALYNLNGILRKQYIAQYGVKIGSNI